MTVFVREKWSEYIKIHKVQTFTFSCIDQPHEHIMSILLWASYENTLHPGELTHIGTQSYGGLVQIDFPFN